ncbi:MAG TPA: SPW repeat protein [Candidatus Limnocylindrales bacterium]|nr:SPW repeat protein [Candidatus Limnocylindrales bacterium]
MKRRMLLNLILGLWLMISPFVLVTLNRSILKTLWEDLLLGFGIAAFSLCRLLSRKEDEIVLSDWFVTALGFITLINPFLYSYFKLKAAAWNNLGVGALVLLLALYQDWQDTDAPDNAQHESRT